MNKNEMRPELSVIVPVYNTEPYLERCVLSLTEQTKKDIEIILVDDGSTDESGKLCDEFADKDERIVVIHKENAGQGLARNDGLLRARGTYVSFLDSDDLYERDACEILTERMKETGADILSYGYEIDDHKGQVVVRPPIRERIYEKTEDKDEIRNAFILHLFGDSMKDDDLRAVSSCMSVFRTELIREHGISFPSERVVSSEDNAFSLAYCRYVKKAATLDKTLYHYCQNEASFSQGYRKDKFYLICALDEMLRGYAAEYGFDKEDPLFEDVRGRIAHTAWVGIMALLKQEYRHAGKKGTVEEAKKIREDKRLSRALKELPYADLPVKQRLLYHLLVKRYFSLVSFLIGIRAKSRL